MSRAQIYFGNELINGTGTITPSGSTATGYPVTNLLNEKRQLIVRSVSNTSAKTLQINFNPSRNIKAIFAIDPVLHVGGTLKIEVDTGSGFTNFGGGTGLCTIPTNWISGITGIIDASGAIGVTDIRLTFSNPSALNTYVELGKLFVVTADYYEPSINISDDFSIDDIDRSQAAESLNGQEFFNVKDPYSQVSAVWQDMTGAEKDVIVGIRRDVGGHTPIVFAFDPDDFNKVLYGRLGPSFQYRHGTLDQWTIGLPFREAR